MELYLDTANIDEIKAAARTGLLDGITTNPSIIAKEKKSFQSLIQEIDGLVDGKIWCQATGESADKMIEEAARITTWAKQVVIKVPMNEQGLTAASQLVKKGIEVNMTLVYSLPQAVLAAKAGVAYVSPYVGRLDDQGSNGIRFIQEVQSLFRNMNASTKVIAASIRSPQIVVELVNAGVDAVTMSNDTFSKMMKSLHSEMGLQQFNADWNQLQEVLSDSRSQ